MIRTATDQTVDHITIIILLEDHRFKTCDATTVKETSYMTFDITVMCAILTFAKGVDIL